MPASEPAVNAGTSVIASGVVTPSVPIATALSQNSIVFVWQDNANDESGFQIERKLGLGGIYTMIAQPVSSAGTGSSASYQDTGLAADAQYCYRVRAFNVGGYSSYTAESCATTLTPPPTVTVTLTASPSSIASGATSTLNWLSTNSTSCTSTGGGGTGITGTFTTPPLTTTTTYTVTCTGAGGSASRSATVIVAGTLPASTLNDTGITVMQCYQAGSDILVACDSAGALALNPAQDGMAGRDTNEATNSATDGRLGFSFTAVPASGVDTGGCVQDNVTGLMWEVKTDDDGLRDWLITYTNYDSTTVLQKWNGTAYVAPTPAEIDAPTNSVGFKNSVNAQGLCGFSDWRLPTADELQNIVDYGVAYPGPTIDTSWFPNTQGNLYWSASHDVADPGDDDHAWNVYFFNGNVSVNSRNFSYPVRLVRAGQSPSTPRYTVSANGQEVTDNQTKLIWRRCAEGMDWDGTTCAGVAGTFTHEAALIRAKDQAVSTAIAWRLPNVRELSSIVDRSRSNPAIDPAAFPATPVNVFWSASPLVGYASGYAWGVDFGDGVVDLSYLNVRNSSNPVRLVRAGQ